MSTTEASDDTVPGLVERSRRIVGWMTSGRGAAVIVALLTLFGLALRLWNLDKEPLHVDELRQVIEVQAPLLEVIHRSYVLAQPPLDYIIGWLTVQIGPATDFSQRLPAALFGTSSVGLVGLVLVRAKHHVAAIFAAFFVAISPLLVELSQYVRPYALPVFTVLSTIALYQHWHLRSKRWQVLALFGLSAALALLSRPVMPLIALGTLGVIALVKALLRHRLSDPLSLLRSDLPGLVVLPAAFLLVWVPSSMYINSGFLVDCWQCNKWSRLATGVENFGEFGEFAVRPTSLVLLLFLAVVVIAFRPARSALGDTWYLWAPLLLTGPGYALVHALVLPPGTFFAIRYLVFLPIGLVVYLAVGIAAIGTSTRGKHLLVRAAVTIVLLVFVAQTASAMLARLKFQSEGLDLADWRSTAEYIESIEAPGDVIISIDTRPFSRETKFGFEAYPRYYDGSSPFFKPEHVISDPTSVMDAGRYHFVLFVPKMAGGWSVPSDWIVADFSEMKIMTTPSLLTNEFRVDAWWILSESLRPDVAITTQIAGGSLAAVMDSTGDPWFEVAREEAALLNQGDYADQLITRVMDP
ncbi:MAG: glycosyltransferase family 39 protein [Acidimicrobiia bacterium]